VAGSVSVALCLVGLGDGPSVHNPSTTLHTHTYIYIYICMYVCVCEYVHYSYLKWKKMTGRMARGNEDGGRPEFSPKDLSWRHAPLIGALG
jgi:hypothetical protein